MCETGICAEGMLVVRRAGLGPESRPGHDLFTVVQVGATAVEPPLASCVLVRLDDRVAEIRDLVISEWCCGAGMADRLAGEVAHVLRVEGLRRLRGVHQGSSWLELEL